MKDTYEVERDGKKIRLPLSALTADEVLGVANGLLRAGLKDQAQPLYRLQHAMRDPRVPTHRPPAGDAE